MSTCIDGCGRPVYADGMSKPCWRRWDRAGRPASGPPAPRTPAECARIAQEARRAQAAGGPDAGRQPLPPDAVDLEEARLRRERLAALPEARITAAASWLRDGVRCLRAGDANGLQVVWASGDVPAVFVAALARIAVLEDALAEGGERASA